MFLLGRRAWVLASPSPVKIKAPLGLVARKLVLRSLITAAIGEEAAFAIAWFSEQLKVEYS